MQERPKKAATARANVAMATAASIESPTLTKGLLRALGQDLSA